MLQTKALSIGSKVVSSVVGAQKCCSKKLSQLFAQLHMYFHKMYRGAATLSSLDLLVMYVCHEHYGIGSVLVSGAVGTSTRKYGS